MRNSLSVLLFLCTCLSVLRSQEVLTPLGSNDIVKSFFIRHVNSSPNLRSASANDTITLPFKEDFSGWSIYPDTARWLDSNVFVNRTFGRAPISLGVATFDGLSKTGAPYDTVSINFNASQRCDSLTSRIINLNFPSDSVYLSFFYQAKGFGEAPETGDSLLLQFRSPTIPWTTVWKKEGYSPSNPDTSFNLVMIKIDSSGYLVNGFQFRFLNLGTRMGNVDHWNLDYIILDRQRTFSDTVFNDVGFVYQAQSFLQKYWSMPWNQYNTGEMKSSFLNQIRNNDVATKNTTYEYKVFDQGMVQVNTTYSGVGNIDPFLTSNYTICTVPTACNNLLQPNVNYNFPTMSGNTFYTIEHSVKTVPDLINGNDTVRHKQMFSNYYAYDDGTAELAYGLNVIGGKIAYKFTLNQADTLRAVDMYFNWMPNGLSNPPVNSVSQRTFRLMIYADNGGQPGNLIYMDSIMSPDYQYEFHSDWGNLSNHFVRYQLTTPQVLSGTFYVGWIQYTTNLLNIGMDLNTNNSSKMFYNTAGTWNNTVFSGSWMIRPVMGTPSEAMAGQPEDVSSPLTLKLWPNPAQEELFFSLPLGTWNVRICNIMGQEVYTVSMKSETSSIRLEGFLPGVYHVVAVSEGKNLTGKFIVVD